MQEDEWAKAWQDMKDNRDEWKAEAKRLQAFMEKVEYLETEIDRLEGLIKDANV